MPADVTFISGRAGAGKSRAARELIRQRIRAKERPVLVVPEQFTFESERELARAMGGGLLGVQVLSFSTLAARVLRETGCRGALLSREGRRMLIRRCIREHAGELKAFGPVAERPGFALKCDELFSLCKRFSIGPETLFEAAERLGEAEPLRDKLLDLALLFERTEALLAPGYLDGEDALHELTARFGQSTFADRDYFLDEFDIFAAELTGVIGALMEHARSICICICLDPDPNARDGSVFAPESRAFVKLLALAREKGCKVAVKNAADLERARDPGERQKEPALEHLERELFAYPARPYEGDASGIRVFAASSVSAEVEALACAVSRAAREGVRYRDMAVLCADLGRYALPVRRAFLNHGIPLFLDAGRPLQGHPAAVLMVSALRCAERGFFRSDFLDLIKSGLCRLADDQADALENYMLRFGLQGSMLLRPFERGEEGERQAAEEARTIVMDALLPLREGLRAKSAREKTRALYEYLVRLDVAGQLQKRVEALREEQRLELADENAQIYNLLIELLDQLYTIVGDDAIPLSKYLAMLEEGMAAYEAGIIPTTTDQVLLGNLSRTRARAVRALFVLGAAEGVLPRHHHDDSVIDDSELACLSALGLNVWGGSDVNTMIDTFELYRALSRPTELLYLSYPLSLDGRQSLPSELLDRIRAIFPSVQLSSDIGAELQLESLCSQNASAGLLARALRRFADTGRTSEPLEKLYAYFARAPQAKQTLFLLESALYYDPAGASVPSALAQSLYPDHTSASRLELFNACPFRHLVEYGICARPRQEYRERPLDEGSFYHSALDALVKLILRRGIPFSELDAATVDALVDQIAPGLLLEHNGGILEQSERLRARGRRMVRTLKATAFAMVRQIAMGEFLPVACEVAFAEDGALKPIELCGPAGRTVRLVGKIDRIDLYDDGKNAPCLRVVDYKRGTGTDFDFAELYAGIRLQLPLYLAAAMQGYGGARAAGMYYLGVKEPVVDEGEQEDKLLKEYRLDGVSLDDAGVLNAADRESGGRDSKVLSPRRATDAELTSLTRFAQRKAADTVNALLTGRAEVSPYRRGRRTACAHCEHAGVCCFDQALPGCRFRSLSPLKQEAFFELIGQDEPKE
ncbi:MAG: PD-(D/E)XK nuclease family protein [Bacillota bacterium]